MKVLVVDEPDGATGAHRLVVLPKEMPGAEEANRLKTAALDADEIEIGLRGEDAFAGGCRGAFEDLDRAGARGQNATDAGEKQRVVVDQEDPQDICQDRPGRGSDVSRHRG